MVMADFQLNFAQFDFISKQSPKIAVKFSSFALQFRNEWCDLINASGLTLIICCYVFRFSNSFSIH